jgi:hypothetical protein
MSNLTNTPNLNWPLPDPQGLQQENIQRIRTTLTAIDVYARAVTDSLTFFQSSLNNHTHSFAELTGRPTTLAGYGIADSYTATQIDGKIAAEIAALIDGAPEFLDTFREFAAAIGNDPNHLTTITTQIGLKLDASAYTAEDVLAKLRTVDGAGSGLDADTWQGLTPGYFAPAASLHSGLAARLPISGGELTGKLTTWAYPANDAQNDSAAALEVRNNGAGVAAISFHCQGGYGIKLHLRSDGYFGLGGWSSSAWRWYSVPNGDMIAAGNIGAYSDPRLKEEIERIEGALDIIDKLDGVRYRWNNRSKMIGRPGERDIGVLSDQVEAVLPELVGLSAPDDENDGKQWKVVYYEKLAAVLIEGIKALRQMARTLTRADRDRGKAIRDLEARVSALEARL